MIHTTTFLFRKSTSLSFYLICGFYLLLGACAPSDKHSTGQSTVVQTRTGELSLPAPDTDDSHMNFSNVIGWSENQKPLAPEGFTVSRFGDDFQNPRWIYEAPNRDVFIAEAATELSFVMKTLAWISGIGKSLPKKESANRITLLRDSNQDGKVDLREVFLEGLNKPLGMLVMGGYFYVANTDGIVRYPYRSGQTKMTASGEKILTLPAGGYNNHWTRNIIGSADSSKIYISVGSASNNAEHGLDEEVRRANILEISPDGSDERIFAAGLRNPVGMDLHPVTKTLWTVVNERDKLGDELVPDYLTSVKQGGFYGWPFAYFGSNEDPRMKGQRPDLVKKSIVPDVSLGAHTASLGMAFYDQQAFPAKYHQGVFIGQHGSWNSSVLVGYKVVFVPFEKGMPSGAPEDFLTGFIAESGKDRVHGRPVGVEVLKDGSILVADDVSNIIWRVSVKP